MCRGGGIENLSLPKNELIIDDVEEINENDDTDVVVSNEVVSNELRAVNSSNTVMVSELWNSSSSTYNSTNLSSLYKALTGNSGASESDVLSLAKANANATTFRANNSGKNVMVMLYGLKWWAMCLDYLDYSDDCYLTLWLADEQSTSMGSSSTNYAVLNNRIYYVPDAGAVNADNYGGETYNTMSCINSEIFTDSKFGLYYFNLGTDKIRNILSTIRNQNVPYQRVESAKEILGMPYNLANESAASRIYHEQYGYPEVPDDGFYSSDNNYYNDWNYQRWTTKRDVSYSPATFLPSLSEIGYSGVSGIWGADASQRACSGTASGTVTINGKDYPAANNIWTRSANYKQSYGYYFVKSSGEGKGIGATYARVVRPAVHILLYI